MKQKRIIWTVRLSGLVLLAVVAAGFVEARNIDKHFGNEAWFGLYPSDLLSFGLMAVIALSSRLLVYGLWVRWRLGLVFAVAVAATLFADNWTWTSGELSWLNSEAAGIAVWFYIFPTAALSLALAAIPLGDGKPRKKSSEADAGVDTGC